MPVSFSSPPRNLFLLGSSGADVVTNFFKTVDKSSSDKDIFVPDEIRFDYDNNRYNIAGTAETISTSKEVGWIERRDYDPDLDNDPSVPTSTLDWSVHIESTLSNTDTTLRAMESYGNDLIVVGKTGSVPWIAKYSNGGLIDWQTTTNSADVEYTGVCSNGTNYYACGNSPVTGTAQAFVEKFDSSGNPSWGKSAFMLGRDVVLEKISANTRGEVIAVGYLEDDTADKGYIVKIDTNTGEVLWDRTLERNISGRGGNSNDDISSANVRCTACYIDGNDQIYIVGSIDGNVPVDNGVGEFLIKYSPEGNMLWQRENNTDHYTNLDGAPNMIPFDVKSDTDTQQTVVLSVQDQGSFALNNSDIFLSKYSRDGSLVFRRQISKGNNNIGAANLDADPSFYYILFRDQQIASLQGEPDRYFFGKVSTSGNGLGDFSYVDGSGTDIDYTIVANAESKIGRLSDGSVRNDASDLITYPFTANKIVFDDLATLLTNKKKQMDTADSFEYSGSPAIRPADFQELNLLGDVYSGSGDWLDQSGKGNDATTSFTTTTTSGNHPGTYNYGTGGAVTYDTYGTVNEDTTTTLPYSNSDWTHYGGKARDLGTGGFKITTTNSATTDFFMSCWVKFDNYTTACQMGVNLFGNYVYWETRSNGDIGVRHNGGSRQDSTGGTNVGDGNWHHIALSRDGSTLSGYVDGSIVVSTTDGVSGNSVPANADFWFFGGNGTAYNIDGQILDPIINIGNGSSGGYTVPTKPLIDSSFNFNDGSSGSGPFFSNSWEYASPAITLGSGTVTTTNGPTHNAAGYWEFDTTGSSPKFEGDYMEVDYDTNLIATGFTLEFWFNGIDTRPGQVAQFIATQGFMDGGSDNDSAWRIERNNSQAGTIEFNVNNGSGFNQNELISTNFPDGTWHHCVCTFDTNGTRTIYKNGVQDIQSTSYTGTPTHPAVDHALRIGARYDAAPYAFNGSIGEFRIYPRALTEAQAYQNYNATKSKYINEAPDTAPKIGPGVVTNNNLLLNYDFGNRATYDRAENMLGYSEDFFNWTIQPNTTVQEFQQEGDIPSPLFGDRTVRLITANQTESAVYQAFTGVANRQHVFSVYIKPGSVDNFRLRDLDGGSNPGHNISINLANNVQVFSDANNVNAGDYGVTELPNGWYRVFFRFTTGNYTNLSFNIRPTASQTGTFYLWGAQVELGSIPGRYIRTYGSAITAPTTVKNLSEDRFNGTVIGCTFNSDGYFDFDPSENSEITIAHSSNMAFVNSIISCEAWVYIDTLVNGGTEFSIINKRGNNSTQNNNRPYVFGVNGDGRIRWILDDASTLCDTATGLIQTGQWYHLAATHDGTDAKVYVNGVVNTTVSSGTSSLADTGNIPTRIGSRYRNSDQNFSDGRIAELRVYNTGLSATEISKNFNATRGKYGV